MTIVVLSTVADSQGKPLRCWMLKCDHCDTYQPHAYRARDGVQDAYCQICKRRNFVIIVLKDDKVLVIDAINGAVHNAA